MKKLWGLRHIRYFYLRYKLNKFLDEWMSVGGLPIASKADIDYLDAIWKGEE
tara:strand:- start:438 stop:593 length:156 start_codon:yes stop_codon:yes gene_type:complete